MLARWTAVVLRARLLVVAGWLLVLVAGGFATTQLSDLLANSFDVPGTESERARELLADHFGERPEGTFVVVFEDEEDPRRRARVEEAYRRAAAAVPTAEARDLRSGGGVLYGEIVTRLELDEAKHWTDEIRIAVHPLTGVGGSVTGQPALQHDLDPVLASDLRRGEALALPLALVVLVALLGWSLAVAIPFVFAACTISATLGLVWLLAHAFDTATYVQNLVALIGVALAIDYSLLVVHRFREELAAGGDVDDAVVRTMATAGRAVVFSGFAVAIGLGLLLLVPVPFVRSMGIGGLLIPLVSVAAAVTFQPALLSLLGERVGRGRAPDPEHGPWARLSRAVMRRPKLVFAGATTVLLVLAAPAAALHLSPGSFASIPSDTPAARGLDRLRNAVGGGAVTPTHLVVDAGAPGAARSPAVRAAIARLSNDLAADPETLIVASGRRPPYVDSTGRYAQVIVAGRSDYGEDASQDLVRRLREHHVAAARFPAGATTAAGGAPPQGQDFLETTYGAFPWLVAAVLLVTYAILLAAFRSVLLPLKAVVLNLLTVGAVYGILVAVFQWGWGRGLLGLEPVDALEGWIPVFLFATLFGLSMDYEVFMVSRMREAWDDVGDNARAVAHGLERTGRIVTAAAAIMVAAFSGFVAGRVSGLEQLGLGLALGVLIDATIVRALLVPSLMALLGRWNWWLPGARRGA